MKKDYFFFSGIFCLLIWLVDTYFKVSRYGTDLDFIWSCSVVTLILGLGLFYRKIGLILLSLGIIISSQVFWILDYIWYILFGKALTTTAMYLFSSVVPFDEFLVGLRHLILLPIAIYGWYLLGQKSEKAKLYGIAYTAGFAAFIRLFTPPSSNFNCLFEPCVNFLEWGWPSLAYFFFFTTFVIFVIILVINFFNWLTDYIKKNALVRYYLKEYSFVMFFFSIFVIILFMVQGVSVYFSIPHYTCRTLGDDFKCHALYEKEDSVDLKFVSKMDGMCKLQLKDGYFDYGYKTIKVEKDESYWWKLPLPKYESKLRMECLP